VYHGNHDEIAAVHSKIDPVGKLPHDSAANIPVYRAKCQWLSRNAPDRVIDCLGKS